METVIGKIKTKRIVTNEDTYDIQTKNKNFFANDVLVHNSEIILRPYQFCNLTEVIVRSDDTIKDIQEKIKVATILGTIQSSLTYFPYLRKIWKKNTEEERLLGVSLTGIYDNNLLNDHNDPELSRRLEKFREIAVETNKEWAEKLGVAQSTSITCVKPSGTISELCDTASGIHPRHSEYYIRRIRADNKDPVTEFLKLNNVPNEPDVTKPASTTVFSFVKKAPKGAKLRDEITSIDHLNLWLTYQRYWCEHKPSVTISVKESDWPAVGAWVWDHFDEMTGVSFLPYDGGTYRQAPYESITKEQYDELVTKIPDKIDWTLLQEHDDLTEGVQNLACVAGGCTL